MKIIGRKTKIFLAITLLVIFFILGVIINIFIETRIKVTEIRELKPNIALKILDRKGRLIANVFSDEFRYYAEFNEIPTRLIETLLAVEDTSFFEHNGINFDAISRAMIKNLKNAKLIEGGSTITQQLVKNVALSMDRTIDRKIKEAILSFQIENVLSKEEILERYLNYINFGHGFYGVKTAAQGYFDKELKDLSLKEMAMMMALPKAPSSYDPTKNLELSLNRANSILERMYSIGWITQDEYNVAKNEVPKVYNKTLSQNLAPYVVDETLRQLSNIKDIKTGGYTVVLNIDLDYQKIAQQALINGYDNITKRLNSYNDYKDISNDNLNGAIIVTQSQSGNILALSGGIDYTKSNFNRATQTKRQFGSAIKPFIYQIAFDMGYSQASDIPDIARSFETEKKDKTSDNSELNVDESLLLDENKEESKNWSPVNYSGNLKGVVTLKNAIKSSLNLAIVNLVDIIGFNKIYDAMGKFGFQNMQKDMSIILGSLALSPLEAIEHYSVFANYGTMINPKLINKIITFDGHEIIIQKEEDEAITTPQQAFLMIDSLKNVVSKGSGARAYVPGIELAGKTGTSNKNVDAWFSGFSPTLQVVIWYGRDNNQPIGPQESGGVIAAPVFADFFKNILKVEPGLKRNFDIPNGVYKQTIDNETYYFTQTSKIPKNKNDNYIYDNLIY